MSDTPVKSISGLVPEELTELLGFSQGWRAKQVFKWIADGARSFDLMTNLPLEERQRLSSSFRIFSTQVTQTLTDPDGTVKLQISLSDDQAVETVLLTDAAGRKTACVSCQVGCPMGCAFCQTGHIGYSRDLSADEIIEQFFHLEATVGKLDNIVFMGMGEPLLNLPAIRKTVEILTHPQGRGLSRRRITVSTCGLCDGIRDLADNGPDIRLAVSLTVADDQLRTSLMPVNKKWNLEQLQDAIRYYNEKTGKRVTLEAAVMAGINTDREHASLLEEFARPIDVHINIIPWNPVNNLPFTTPGHRETERFVQWLEKAGLNVTLRRRRGREIGGACGQLGRSTSEKSNEI